MSSYVFLRKVRLHANHGVMEQEQCVGAEFEVSLRVKCDCFRAVETDDVSHTLSYADLYEVVKREMQQRSHLLEHVAGRIAKAVFRQFPQAEALDVEIVKLNPPMGARSDGAGVELHMTRGER